MKRIIRLSIADLVLPFYFEKEDLQKGFTKRDLIEFLDGLVELASEESKAKAVLVLPAPKWETAR